MPQSLQTSFMLRPSTFFPWSFKIDNSVPKQVNTCSTNILATVLVSLLRSGNASDHFVYESRHGRIQICPLSLFGWGPVISIYHCSYGAPANTGFSAPASSVFLGGIRCIPDIFNKNAQQLFSTRTNKTFVLLGPTSFGSRSVHPLFQRGTIAVHRQLCFVVAAAAGC